MTKKMFVVLAMAIMVLTFNQVYAGADKVAICHNGHTIWVSENAVDSHLSHGDFLGECGDDCEIATNQFDESLIADETAESTEARKFGIYKMALNHPNTPGAGGLHLNYFVDTPEFGDAVSTLPEGEYHVRIEITDPEGAIIAVEAVFTAIHKQKEYYDAYVELE